MMTRTFHIPVRWLSSLSVALCALLLWVGCGQQQAERGGTSEITVITEPVGAQVFLNGEPQGISPTKISGLSAGSHLIEVRRSGYRTKFETIRLFDGQRVAREMGLEPLRGLLLVESTPPGASVLVDESYRGETPLLLHDLALGAHRLLFQADHYFPREMTVDLEDRAPRHVQVELVSDTAVLAIDSDPAGATVRIDGATHGETPVQVDRVKTGSVLVEVLLEGFVPFQQEMKLRAGERAKLDAHLVPLPSGLTVYSTPAEGRVYINEEFRGETPLILTNLTVGSYTLRVEKKGYSPQQHAVELGSGARHVEEFRLERNSGTLILVTEPAGAQVYVDGELVGTTEAGESNVLSLPFTVDLIEQGEHRLTLTMQGYSYRPKPFRLQVNQVLSMHERLTRVFTPNTVVRTGEGSAEVYTGVLVRRHRNGDVDLETHPGIIVTLPADEIVAIEPLRRDE